MILFGHSVDPTQKVLVIPVSQRGRGKARRSDRWKVVSQSSDSNPGCHIPLSISPSGITGLLDVPLSHPNGDIPRVPMSRLLEEFTAAELKLLDSEGRVIITGAGGGMWKLSATTHETSPLLESD